MSDLFYAGTVISVHVMYLLVIKSMWLDQKGIAKLANDFALKSFSPKYVKFANAMVNQIIQCFINARKIIKMFVINYSLIFR